MNDTPKTDAGMQAAIVPVTPFEQNCTLVWDAATKVGAVVDPGGEPGKILDAIARLACSSSPDARASCARRSC